jgi:hypothetical protein
VRRSRPGQTRFATARVTRIRQTLKRGHPHGNRLLSAGTGGACSL